MLTSELYSHDKCQLNGLNRSVDESRAWIKKWAGNLTENIELMDIEIGGAQIRSLDSGAVNAIAIVHGGIEKLLIIHY